MALKGGTALNLFFSDIQRLSIDIDLNYIGAEDREVMLSERPKLYEAIEAVCQREGFAIRRFPEEHAGGKWCLRYPSVLGQGGNLEVDVNFMFRIPLWPVVLRDSLPVGSYKAVHIPVLEYHELAAGKLTALLARHASRDLFDTHQILKRDGLDPQRLRIAFIVYGGINRKDWRTVSTKDVDFEERALEQQLLPLLRKVADRDIGLYDDWARRLVKECQDAELVDRIRRHPGLKWKAFTVRQFKSK